MSFSRRFAELICSDWYICRQCLLVSAMLSLQRSGPPPSMFGYAMQPPPPSACPPPLASPPPQLPAVLTAEALADWSVLPPREAGPLPPKSGGAVEELLGWLPSVLPSRAPGMPPPAESADVIGDSRPPDAIILSGPDFYKPHITCLYGGYKRTRNLYGKATYQKDPDQTPAGQTEAFIYWSAVDVRWCVSRSLGATIYEAGEVAAQIGSTDSLPVPIYQLHEDDGNYPRLMGTWVANLFGNGARYQPDHMLTFEALELPLEVSDPAKSVGGYMHVCTRRFVDYTFPPKVTSICGDPAPLRLRPDSLGPITWVPALTGALEKSGPLFRATTEPRGDWLMGLPAHRCGIYPILAALREYPGQLEALLSFNPDVSPMGCYHVWLFDLWQGKWRRLAIDDFVPMALDVDGSLIPFAGGHGRTLWASIIEKAIAKLCGSYEALSTSDPGPLLMALTGQVPSTMSHWIRDGGWWSRWQFLPLEARKPPSGELQRIRDPRSLKCVTERIAGTWHQARELFATMRQLHRENALLFAYTHPGKEFGGERYPSRPNQKAPGLLIGPGYSVLQLVEVDDDISGNSGLLLVQLRNIWGPDCTWQGPWADNSTEWQQFPEVRKHHLREEYRESGRFWMNWTDFCNIFDRIDVCPMPEAARKASYAPPKMRAMRRTQKPQTRGSSGFFGWQCCSVEMAE